MYIDINILIPNEIARMNWQEIKMKKNAVFSSLNYKMNSV